MADSQRRDILIMLRNERLNAGEIAEKLQITPAALSYHLKLLKNADLISEYKEKNFVYYEINTTVFDELIIWVNQFGGKKYEKIMWIVAMIPVVVTSVVLQFMPDIIPMHHDLEGNTDRWGSKTESFIFPVIILFITLFWHLLIYVFEKNQKCKYRKGTDGNKIFCKGIMCCRNFCKQSCSGLCIILFFILLGYRQMQVVNMRLLTLQSFMYFVWYYIYCIRKFYDKGKTKCSSGSSNRLEYAQ